MLKTIFPATQSVDENVLRTSEEFFQLAFCTACRHCFKGVLLLDDFYRTFWLYPSELFALNPP